MKADGSTQMTAAYTVLQVQKPLHEIIDENVPDDVDGEIWEMRYMLGVTVFQALSVDGTS